MWISKNHPDREELLRQAQQGVTPRGESLAIIPRGEVRQLRIDLESYRGNPYVSISIWQLCPDGSWRPTPGKLVTVRRAELDSALEALYDGLRRIEGREIPEPPPGPRDWRDPADYEQPAAPETPAETPLPTSRRDEREHNRQVVGNLPPFEAPNRGPY